MFKLNRIDSLASFNDLKFKWYKRGRLWHLNPSWSKGLWVLHGDITHSGRMENKGKRSIDKRIRLFRWRY